MAAAPLNDLSRAARALGGDLNRLPLIERGPHEVRDALRAFNAMQAKLRDHVIERTHILASITHDLQTPLTRLRLRLEKVTDIALRSRLIDDLDRMQALIRQGLDFSRGNQTEEPFVPLVLDSLLESVVQDAAEGGRAVVLVECSGYDVEARPQALQRCLANLLDNAVKHGGSAEVSAKQVNGEVQIRIRDHGPGIPPDQLEAVFDPFVRLGLTIARQLAQKNDAELVLANHSAGGLEACLILRRGVVASAGSAEAAYLTPA
jgi:signal transduction histidine kinase